MRDAGEDAAATAAPMSATEAVYARIAAARARAGLSDDPATPQPQQQLHYGQHDTSAAAVRAPFYVGDVVRSGSGGGGYSAVPQEASTAAAREPLRLSYAGGSGGLGINLLQRHGSGSGVGGFGGYLGSGFHSAGVGATAHAAPRAAAHVDPTITHSDAAHHATPASTPALERQGSSGQQPQPQYPVPTTAGGGGSGRTCLPPTRLTAPVPRAPEEPAVDSVLDGDVHVQEQQEQQPRDTHDESTVDGHMHPPAVEADEPAAAEDVDADTFEAEERAAAAAAAEDAAPGAIPGEDAAGAVSKEVVLQLRAAHAAATGALEHELHAVREENARLHREHGALAAENRNLRGEVAMLTHQQTEAANAVVAAQTRHEEAWAKVKERQEKQAKALTDKDALIEKLKAEVADLKAAASNARSLEDTHRITAAKLNKKDKMIAEMRVALDKQQLERRRIEAAQQKQQQQYQETLTKVVQHTRSAQKSAEAAASNDTAQQQPAAATTKIPQDPEIEAILAQVDQDTLPPEGKECITRLVGLVVCGKNDVRRARLQYAKEKAVAAGIGGGGGGGGRDDRAERGSHYGSRTASPAATRLHHASSRTNSPAGHTRRTASPMRSAAPAGPASDADGAAERKGESWQSWAERKRRENKSVAETSAADSARSGKAPASNAMPWRGGGINKKPPPPRAASPSPATHSHALPPPPPQQPHQLQADATAPAPLPTVTIVGQQQQQPQAETPAADVYVAAPAPAVAVAAEPSPQQPAAEATPGAPVASMPPPSLGMLAPAGSATGVGSYRSASPPPGLISLVGSHRPRPMYYDRLD